MGRCLNSIVVNAPADEVWAALRNFHDLSWAPNVIQGLEPLGEKGPTEAGAKRRINGAITETLIECDDAERSVLYSIDDGPGPLAADAVTSYRGAVRVFPVTSDGRTFVLWTSDYQTRDDAAVREFCDPIYQALLQELAARFG